VDEDSHENRNRSIGYSTGVDSDEGSVGYDEADDMQLSEDEYTSEFYYGDEDDDDYEEYDEYSEYDDGESALMDLLIEAYEGDGEVLSFGYADYDSDGRMEAFALVGVYDDAAFENMAELWYVCGDFAMQCERAGSCYPFDSYVTSLHGQTVFRVSEGYFGSGGAQRYWSAANEMSYLLEGDYMLDDLNMVY